MERTPEQVKDTPLPPWYRPFARDKVIRGVLAELGIQTIPRHLGIYVLRQELVKSIEALYPPAEVSETPVAPPMAPNPIEPAADRLNQ